MADINKTNAVTNGNVPFTPTAGASSQTIAVSKDERMVVYVKNGGGSALTVTIPKGTGIAGVKDLVVPVSAGAEAIIGPLESAAFGNKGKITVNLSATASVMVGAIQL